jgi:RND superfamily putative drug exporter
MLFCILFGLSMDYQIFLSSRIKEHHDRTGRDEESIAHGLRTTGAIITGAALIMVAVFAGFALGDLTAFQQMGLGLAIAVLVDAFVVRTILVPSTMRNVRAVAYRSPVVGRSPHGQTLRRIAPERTGQAA